MIDVRKLAAGSAALAAGLFVAAMAFAAAPQLKGQAPGYYRNDARRLRDHRVSDGTVPPRWASS